VRSLSFTPEVMGNPNPNGARLGVSHSCGGLSTRGQGAPLGQLDDAHHRAGHRQDAERKHTGDARPLMKTTALPCRSYGTHTHIHIHRLVSLSGSVPRITRPGLTPQMQISSIQGLPAL